jgi:hypothetical protein
VLASGEIKTQNDYIDPPTKAKNVPKKEPYGTNSLKPVLLEHACYCSCVTDAPTRRTVAAAAGVANRNIGVLGALVVLNWCSSASAVVNNASAVA